MKKNKTLIVLALAISLTYVISKKNILNKSVDGPGASPVAHSDLRYEEIHEGGGKIAALGKKVTIHYVATLAKNGKKFDSSVDRRQPFEFKLGTTPLVKGLDSEIVGMSVGGKRKIMIPSEQAYGARGAGDVVPSNSDLIFEVELLKVE